MLPVQDKTVFLSVLTKSGSDIDKESYQAPGLVAKMNIQPANAETTVMVDGQYGKTFDGFTTNSGVTEGMKVTVSGRPTDQYIVKGREVHDNGVLPPHYELVLIRETLP